MLEVIRLVFIVLNVFGAQILEQPNPGAMFVSVHVSITLTCSVEDGYGIDWRVAFPNVSPLLASSMPSQVAFMQRNCEFEGVGTSMSTLSLRETEMLTNNGTNITCIVFQTSDATSRTTGNTVQVFFYRAPPPPTDLNVTENDMGSLNISWSLKFIEGIPVNYTLTVLNLNTTSAQPIIIAGLLDQHYVFETSRSCDVYSFTVISVTAAGNSIPSHELIFTSDTLCTVTLADETTTANETPMTDDTTTQPTRLSSSDIQESPATTLIITISGSIAVLMIILVLVAVSACVACYCCHKKMKELATSKFAEPVYEIPGEARTFSSAASATSTMTLSSAHRVPRDNNKFTQDSNPPFAMMASPAYGVSLYSHKPTSGVK